MKNLRTFDRHIFRPLTLSLATLLFFCVGAFGQQADKDDAKKRKSNPVFAPVEDDPSLPRVLLIGDSISMGFTLAVRGKLAGKANKAPGDVHFTDEGYALLAEKVAAEIAARLPAASGAKVLFDGSDLADWLFAEDSWEIDAEGAMTCLMDSKMDAKTGAERITSRGDIWSRDTYRDFELTLGYKLSEGANSGVFYRCNMDNPVQDGFEIQLMDNVGFQKTHGEKEPRKLNGSFYDCLAPSSDPQNAIGEWNTLTLRCEGPLISLRINGTETFSVDVNDWDTPLVNPDGTSNKFKIARKDASRTGRIGFQNHGQVVWFRDVKIRRL